MPPRVSAKGTPSEGWDRNTWAPLADLARNHPEAGVHFQRTQIYNRKKDASTATAAWFAELVGPNPWFKNLFDDVSRRTTSHSPFQAEFQGPVPRNPHSGAQANTAVFLACLKPGDKILGLDLSMGGHLTHGSPANFSGKTYHAFFYGVKKETGLVDYEQLEATARAEKPKMIICGASAYSRDWDYQRIRAVADEIGALVMADIAHPAGLIAKGLLNDPFDHCHIVTSTTHKTLRGPRGGIIMLRNDFENPFGIKDPKGNTRTMSALLDLAVFPGMQGGPLEHVIAAKAVAFGEILTDEFTVYAKQVVSNAQAIAKEFVNKGYNLISDGTDNHLMLIDLRNKNLTGKKAQETLDKAQITLNKNAVPFDDKSPFVTSGIRVGVPSITTRGMKEADMKTVVDMIDNVLMNADNEKVIADTKHQVNEFMKNFPLYPEL